MAFVKTTWQPGRAGGTPIGSAALNRIEQGIADVHTALGLLGGAVDMWRIGNAAGPLANAVGQFTLPAGATYDVAIWTMATCYASGAAGMCGIITRLDGADLPIWGDYYFNEVGSRKKCDHFNVVNDMAPGTHTLTLRGYPNTVTDSNDRFAFLVVANPDFT